MGGKPCKVIDISTSKTGKHGHAKCKFVALNIFTGAKQEDMQPAGHNMSAPLVKKMEYSLMDITDDDYFCMMNEAGDMKEYLSSWRATNSLATCTRRSGRRS